MKTTKKNISGILKRKSKGEKESSAGAKQSEFLQASEASPNIQSMTCPNNKCGRVFDKPLELIDLAKQSDERSYVCPYCLFKLEPIQPEQETAFETFSDEKLQDATKEKEGNCPQFLGYLGKRPKNAPIPEFCLTCPQMMKCLLG